MAVVKGSEQDFLEIRRYSPMKQWRNRALIGVAAVFIITCVYFWGSYSSLSEIEELSQSNATLTASLAERNLQLTSISQRASVLEKGGEVDRQAADGMRKLVRDLQTQVAKLEEDVTFYKGIMAPNSVDKGLRVSKIEIKPSKKGRFRYSVMMTQVADNSRFVKGVAALNVVGLIKGKRVVIPIRDLDDKVTTLGTKFRFRYYQELAGEITLPPSFVAQQLQVVLQSTGAKSQRLEKTHPWPGTVSKAPTKAAKPAAKPKPVSQAKTPAKPAPKKTVKKPTEASPKPASPTN